MVLKYALAGLQENKQNVCASIADGANEIPSTNLDAGEPPLRRQRRSRKRAMTDPLTTIATEPAVLPDVPSCPYCHAKRFHQEPPGFCCASGSKLITPLTLQFSRLIPIIVN